MKKRKFWLHVVIVIVFAVVSWVLYISLKQIERNRRIGSEVAALAAEADTIRRENETLKEKISYLSSPEFIDQEAKDKLGFQKPDEQVVVIKPMPTYDQATVSAEEPKDRVSSGNRPPRSLIEKWWECFFEQS